MPTPTDRSAEAVLLRLFTSANPDSGSTPPPHMAWVVFEHGTSFFTAPTDALPVESTAVALLEAARAALDELGPAQAGAPAGDFNVSWLKAWYPGEFVFFVTFDHDSIATIVVRDCDGDLAAGLEGRSHRNSDVKDKRVVAIRAFDGALSR